MTAITIVGPCFNPQPSEIGLWAASVGKTVADCAALVLTLPLPSDAYSTCERIIRGCVADEIAKIDGLMDTERTALENVAWLAFDRRLALHTRALPSQGSA